MIITKGIRRYFKDSADNLGDFKDKAMEESDFLIKKLAERKV